MKFSIKRHYTFLCVLASLLLPIATANAIVKLGFAAWNHDPGGSIRYQGTDASAETGLQLSDETEGFFWIAIETPVPGIPNFKLSHTKLSNSGGGILTNSFTFGGNTFNISENVSTTLDLNQTDLTIYWQLSNKGVEFDLGLTIKYLDGSARVNSLTTSQVRNVDFAAVLPLAYASLDFGTPLKGMSFGVSGNVISYRGHSYSDVLLRVSYETKSNIGIQAGYRRMQLKLDDLNGVSSDLNFSGPYLGVFFNF